MADALTRAADDILARWPPDKSPAAEAFALRIQQLAATFRDAAAAAGTNGPTLSATNIGFAVSHNKIAELRDEWARLRRDEKIRVMVARSALAAGGGITLPLTEYEAAGSGGFAPGKVGGFGSPGSFGTSALKKEGQV